MFKKHLVIFIFCFFNINILIADTPNLYLDAETKKIIKKYLPDYKIVGKANYSFLIWNIYDATLITKSGKFNDDEFINENTPDKTQNLVAEISLVFLQF